MDIIDVQKKLNSVNWNFDFTINYDTGMIHPFNCRKYYSYPATFIPEIPYTLIEILSKKGDVILDPFGGIGTAFMQALILERIPYSFDINPIATNVCNVLYRLLNPNLDHENIKAQLLGLCDQFDANISYSDMLSPYREELIGWFEQQTFNEISYLFIIYDQIIDPDMRLVLELVLPSILTTLSSQNKGWAYIADNVKPKADEMRKKNVFDEYQYAIKTLFNDVTNLLGSLSNDYIHFYGTIEQVPRVLEVSIVNCNLANDSIDMIITSPPYPKMIDYVKSQRLSFYFAERDFHMYVEQETGARYRRDRKNELMDYEQSINEINKKMFELLKTDGFLCLVLPDYESQDKRREVIERIVKSYSELGLKKIFEIGRYIPSHKRTLSIQWATLVNERIYIFQKG